MLPVFSLHLIQKQIKLKNILHHYHLHGLPVHFHILMNIAMENYGLMNMKEMQ